MVPEWSNISVLMLFLGSESFKGLLRRNSWKWGSSPKMESEWSKINVLMPFLGSESFKGS